MTTTPEPPARPEEPSAAGAASPPSPPTPAAVPAPYDAPAGAAPVTGPTGASSLGGTSRSAGWALGLGVLSLFCVGIVVGPIAIVFGVRGRREVRESGGALAGGTMATAGIVIGILGILASLGWLRYLSSR